MNPSAVVPAELQAEALVEQIQRQVAARRRELLDAAELEASAARQRARDKARRQLHRAIADLRETERQRVQQLRAELESATRRRAAANALDMLSSAWPRLGQAIERRWDDPVIRAPWVHAQLAQACARLPQRGWVLRHPAGWGNAELSALRDALHVRGVAGATLLADAELRVGLVIAVDGVRLDSTPQALLADRARIEAALLARLAPGQRPVER